MFTFEAVTFLDILNIPFLSIDSERITSLVGASGSGKTTVLKMLNKMVSPTSGRILYHDHPLLEIDSVTHRRDVCMLSQSPIMFDGNVKDNLVAGLKFQKRDLPDDETLTEMLDRVHLNKPLSASVAKLSGGEKQRLALGRILLLDASVYLMDEPSSALDDNTATAIVEMITSCVRENKKSLVLVTHSRAVADQYSDDIIEIKDNTAIRRSR
ncbi:MAG: ATP-binding cassette domain-containing protein [Clostridiales bacterium]|nr:ATP-binding cassette domain-containing protein [Clostridiales bacterium]